MRVVAALAAGVAGFVISAMRLPIGPSVFIALLVAAWTWVLAGLIGRRLIRSGGQRPAYDQPLPRQRAAPPAEVSRPRSEVDYINPFGPRR